MTPDRAAGAFALSFAACAAQAACGGGGGAQGPTSTSASSSSSGGHGGGSSTTGQGAGGGGSSATIASTTGAGGLGGSGGSGGAGGCPQGFGDCGGEPGCTTNLETDLSNCGACGHPCIAANAASSCVAAACKYTCTSGFADCDGLAANGCEANLEGSATCGSCGHDCLGGACTAGACGPGVLVSALSGPFELTLDTKNLYFSCLDGTLKSVPLAGGTVTTLLMDQSPDAIALDATNVYFSNTSPTGSGAVMFVPIAGAASPTPLAPAASSYGVDVDATNVYFTSLLSGAVQVVPKVGGTPMTLGTAQQPHALRVDASGVYYVDSTGLVKIPTGGAAMTLSASAKGAFTLDATNVYYLGGVGVESVPLAGGSITALATTGAPAAGARITVDATRLYVTSGTPAGTVVSLPKAAAGAVTTLASGQDFPVGVAVNPAAVYWANANDGTIRVLVR